MCYSLIRLLSGYTAPCHSAKEKLGRVIAPLKEIECGVYGGLSIMATFYLPKGDYKGIAEGMA